MYSGDFSLWCDFLERDFIDNEFRDLVANNVFNGATSNPSIFKNAILTSIAYSETRAKFSKKTAKELYEILATQDIRMAAEVMLKNYVSGNDGFVSLEVDPNLSDNTEATFKEGKRLYSTIGMPNVMIKIPATKAGYEAMSELIKKGINVNATLIFSPDQTSECIEAFKEGIKGFKKRFAKANLPKATISIFVSRFDRLLDEKMKKYDLEAGKIGILNATKCYHMIQGANLSSVRALFASTGVKGDEFAKSYYVDELMFKNSVNTAPLDTIKEFINGKKTLKTPANLDAIDKFFKSLKSANVDMKNVYKELLDDGLKQFVAAFDDILKALK